MVDPTLVMQDLEQQLSGNGTGGDGDSEPTSYDKVGTILETMMQAVYAQHNETVKETEDLIKAFSQCNVNKATADGQLQQSKAIVDGKASDHETCRNAEDPLFTQKTTCNNELQTLQNTKDTVCGAMQDMEQDPGQAADVCHSQGETYEAWLDRNAEYFAEKKTKFKKAVAACNNATKAVDDKSPICQKLNDDFDNKKQECDKAQEQLESSTCAYGVEYDSVCGALSSCWGNALAAYNNAKDDIEAGVVTRKASWRAIMRMQCLVYTFGGDNDQNAAIDICINKTHDTSHLDILMAPAPPEPSCEVDEPLPCTADYKAKRYSILPANAQAKSECSQCSIEGEISEKWVLVMKLSGSEPGMMYDDPRWTNDELVNQDSAHVLPGTAKYQRYLNTPFWEMKICVGAMHQNCIRDNFDMLQSNAKSLFSGDYKAAGVAANEFMSNFEVPNSADSGSCAALGVNTGFNSQCANGVKARFGYCAAESGDCSPSKVKSAIGIGLCNAPLGDTPIVGAGCQGPSAGFGGAFSTDGQSSAANVWVWVKEYEAPETSMIQNGWTIIGKLAASSNTGYDDPFWTGDFLLHEDQDAEDVPSENVKYATWTNKSFSHIRVCAKTYDFGTNMHLTDMGGCAEYWLPQTYNNANELFSSGYLEKMPEGSDSSTRWQKVFEGAPSSSTCGPINPGFNSECGNGYKVRIGQCASCTSGQCQISDTSGAIGVGVSDPKTKPSTSFLGCFVDSGDRDLPHYKGNGHTDETCASACQGFQYYGLQWTWECWCGDSYGKHGPTNACDCNSPYPSNIGPWVNCVHTESQEPAGFTDSISAGFTVDYTCAANSPTHLDNVWIWVM